VDEEDSVGKDGDGAGPMFGMGYSWEIGIPSEARVDEYLRGLLWNLATYQDGVCADYGYNYGRRMSPTAKEIVSYLQDVQRNGVTPATKPTGTDDDDHHPNGDTPAGSPTSKPTPKPRKRNRKRHRLGREELLGEAFVPPLNAGLSCLAALPSQVQHLVPEPYRWLSADGSVEDIYASCMDVDANVFDLELFRSLCMERIEVLRLEKKKEETKGGDDTGVYEETSTDGTIPPSNSNSTAANANQSTKGGLMRRGGRKILMGDSFWTVLHRT